MDNDFFKNYIRENLIDPKTGRLKERMQNQQLAGILKVSGRDIGIMIQAGMYKDFTEYCWREQSGKRLSRPTYIIWTRKAIKHITGKDVEEILNS